MEYHKLITLLIEIQDRYSFKNAKVIHLSDCEYLALNQYKSQQLSSQRVDYQLKIQALLKEGLRFYGFLQIKYCTFSNIGVLQLFKNSNKLKFKNAKVNSRKSFLLIANIFQKVYCYSFSDQTCLLEQLILTLLQQRQQNYFGKYDIIIKVRESKFYSTFYNVIKNQAFLYNSERQLCKIHLIGKNRTIFSIDNLYELLQMKSINFLIEADVFIINKLFSINGEYAIPRFIFKNCIINELKNSTKHLQDKLDQYQYLIGTIKVISKILRQKEQFLLGLFEKNSKRTFGVQIQNIDILQNDM